MKIKKKIINNINNNSYNCKIIQKQKNNNNTWKPQKICKY